MGAFCPPPTVTKENVMRPVVVLLSVLLACLLTGASSAAQEVPAEAAVVTLDTDSDGVIDTIDACPSSAGPADDDPKKNGCTSKALAKQWIVAFISRNAPPGRKTYFKFAEETREEALTRYDGIAEDLVSVAYDPEVKPLFTGASGRSRTVAIILGVMLWETGFRRDVDLGLGPHARGDKGKSWCLMQINVGAGKTAQGFSGEDLVRDRKVCISEGLRVVRQSFAACRRLPVEYRLSAYASGSCDKGRDKSRQRVWTGMQWFANSKALRVLFTDEDVVNGPQDLHRLIRSAQPMLARTE